MFDRVIPFKSLIVTVAIVAVLTGCIPPRPLVQPGQQGLVMDLKAVNRGQCELFGPNLAVRKDRVLRGDYFKAVGNVAGGTLRCTMPNGQVVSTTSFRDLYGPGFDYSALAVHTISGPGEVEVIGYSDGPNGKVDVTGTLVFVAE